jgi:hypothetical protein
MKPTLDIIFDFISQRFSLSKAELAKNWLYCDAGKLSRKPFAIKPIEIYKSIFDFNSESSVVRKKDEDKDILLGALKDYLAELKDDWFEIWEKEYETFIMEFLRRACTTPYSGKPPVAQSQVHLENNHCTELQETINKDNWSPTIRNYYDSLLKIAD